MSPGLSPIQCRPRAGKPVPSVLLSVLAAMELGLRPYKGCLGTCSSLGNFDDRLSRAASCNNRHTTQSLCKMWDDNEQNLMVFTYRRKSVLKI